MGLLKGYSVNKGHSLQIINAPRLISQKWVRLLSALMSRFGLTHLKICTVVFVYQQNHALLS